MYEVQFNPFRIILRIDGDTLIIVNDNDSLLFENYEKFIPEYHASPPTSTGTEDDP